jgi:hypothetical protein
MNARESIELSQPPTEEWTMKRLCLFVCALCLGLGCATEADRAQWNEVWKDARGENMQMRGGFSDSAGPDSRLAQKP